MASTTVATASAPSGASSDRSVVTEWCRDQKSATTAPAAVSGVRAAGRRRLVVRADFRRAVEGRIAVVSRAQVVLAFAVEAAAREANLFAKAIGFARVGVSPGAHSALGVGGAALSAPSAVIARAGDALLVFGAASSEAGSALAVF